MSPHKVCGVQVDDFESLQYESSESSSDDPNIANLYQLLKEHVKSEPRRMRRAALQAAGVAGIVSGALSVWGNVRAAEINAKTQLLIAQQQAAEKSQPSTEATYGQGCRDCQQRLADELYARIAANPAPIASAARRIAQSGAAR